MCHLCAWLGALGVTGQGCVLQGIPTPGASCILLHRNGIEPCWSSGTSCPTGWLKPCSCNVFSLAFAYISLKEDPFPLLFLPSYLSCDSPAATLQQAAVRSSPLALCSPNKAWPSICMRAALMSCFSDNVNNLVIFLTN